MTMAGNDSPELGSHWLLDGGGRCTPPVHHQAHSRAGARSCCGTPTPVRSRPPSRMYPMLRQDDSSPRRWLCGVWHSRPVHSTCGPLSWIISVHLAEKPFMVLILAAACRLTPMRLLRRQPGPQPRTSQRVDHPRAAEHLRSSLGSGRSCSACALSGAGCAFSCRHRDMSMGSERPVSLGRPPTGL